MQRIGPVPSASKSELSPRIVTQKEIVPRPGLSRPLRTLIVVKNEETGFRLRALFKPDTRFEVVSDCVSELEVAAVLDRTALDAVVIDLNLPQLGSLPFLAAVNRLGRVLFVLDAEPRLERLLQNKGLPYLSRDCDPGQFRAAATKLVEANCSRLRAHVQSIVRLLSGRYRARSSRLAVRVAKRLLVIDQSEIYSVDTDGKSTWIHLGLESHQIGEPFGQLAERLHGSRLFKISRRILVNLIHIKEITVEPLEACLVRLHNDRIYRLPFHNAWRMRKVVEALYK